MDAASSVSADLVPVALFAPRSRPPPARPRRATRAGPPMGGPVRSTPERTVWGQCYFFFPFTFFLNSSHSSFELYLIVYCQLYLTVTSFKTVIVYKRNGTSISGPQNDCLLKVNCSY